MSSGQKVAIITGASQGIGAGAVQAYRKLGYAVVANSRHITSSADPDVLTVAGDIADPETGAHLVERALEHFGQVDTLVNNAGVFVAKPFTDYTDADFDMVTGVNLRTHIAGIYASLVERPETSPYEIVKYVAGNSADSSPSLAVKETAATIHEHLSAYHQVAISFDEAEAWRRSLVGELVAGSDRLRQFYANAHTAVGQLFDLWFTEKGRSTVNTRSASSPLPQETGA